MTRKPPMGSANSVSKAGYDRGLTRLWMLTMRHLAHCLILLLAPVAAHASDALGGAGQSGCSYAPAEVERVAAPAASVGIANTPPPPAPASKPVQPRAAGGGSDDELIPRLRAPKWHRYLPGMFR